MLSMARRRRAMEEDERATETRLKYYLNFCNLFAVSKLKVQ